MEMSKLKNIVITALVLVNAFFLAITLYNHINSGIRQRRELETLVEVLAQNGIDLEDGAVSEMWPMGILRTSRDVEKEATIAQALLGVTNRVNYGGSIYGYESPAGTAVFRGGGEYEIKFIEGYPAGGGAVKAIKDILKLMGLETGEVEVFSEGGGEYGRVLLVADGAEIYNCHSTFTIINGEITEVSGRLAFNAEGSGDSLEIITAPTALMNFLTSINKENFRCSKIVTMDQGYLLTMSLFGEGALQPVWRIVTDTGIIYIDAVSGEVEHEIEYEL